MDPMTRHLFLTALATTLLLLSSGPTGSRAWPSTADTIGSRTAAEIRGHGSVSVAAGSAQVTISIPGLTVSSNVRFTPDWNTTVWIVPGSQTTDQVTAAFGSAPSTTGTLEWDAIF